MPARMRAEDLPPYYVSVYIGIITAFSDLYKYKNCLYFNKYNVAVYTGGIWDEKCG